MKRVELVSGFTYVRVETTCSHCGMTTSQDLDASINQVCADKVKDNTGKAKATLESRTVPQLAVGWYQMIKTCVTFPFTTEEKDSAERNKQRRIRWKFW